MDNMRELWDIARQYGKVRVSTMDTGLYWCIIEFHTIPGVALKADGDSSCKTPEEAIKQAIKSAQKIVGDMSDLQTTVDRLKAIPYVK